MSRIDAILDDSSQDLSMKVAIIDELERIITAKTGYTIVDTSMFSDRVLHGFIFPEIDARKEALEFLVDRFEDFPEYLQYLSIQSLTRIINNPATCYEPDNGVCDEDDAEEQQEWNLKIIEQVGNWLEEDFISVMIKTTLIRFLETIAVSADNQGNDFIRSLLEHWEQNTYIQQSTLDMIRATLNKLDGNYPELIPLDSQTALTL